MHMRTPCTRLQYALEHDHRLARAGRAEDDVRRAAVAVREHVLHCGALQSVELRLERLDRGRRGARGGIGGGEQVGLGGQQGHDLRHVLGEVRHLPHEIGPVRFGQGAAVLHAMHLAQPAQAPLPLTAQVLHAQQVAHELHRLAVEAEAQVAVLQA